MSTSIIVFMTIELDEITKKICLKIKIERVKRNWSQEEMSARCGISKNSLGAIERMQNSPTTLSLSKIAQAYGITVSELTDISKVDL